MIARPGLLRQACAAATASRSMTRPATFSTFRASVKTPIARQLAKPAFLRSIPAGPIRVAVFHSSAKRELLPAKPQVVEGTANEAVKVPEPHGLEGAYHWTFERAVCVALIPITVAPFVGASMHPILDASLCGLLVVHSHMGFNAMITDYLPTWRVPKTRKLFEYGMLAGTALVGYGLWEFETNDVGLVEAVKRVWTA